MKKHVSNADAARRSTTGSIHYATLTIVIISNIVSLGIAMLFAQHIGNGLAYFEFLKSHLQNGKTFQHVYAASETKVVSTAQVPPRYMAGELIVKFKSTQKIQKNAVGVMAASASINSLNQRYGINDVRELQAPKYTESTLANVVLLTSKTDLDIQQAVAAYRADPNVEYAEPNYTYSIAQVDDVPSQPAEGVTKEQPTLQPVFLKEEPVQEDAGVSHQQPTPKPEFSIPNDPLYSQQWSLGKLDALDAWKVNSGSSKIIIASVDTGIDYNHEDLSGNIWSNTKEIPNNGIDDDNNGYIDDVRGWNFNSYSNDPMDDFGHGTHTAGTMAAIANNGLGIAGVCPGCTIMPIKFLDSNGSGSGFAAAQAIVYAVDNGANVINNSWGGGGDLTVLRDAFAYAYKHNVVTVAAAGNSSTDETTYPADYPHVIKVAATDENDERTPWSNYGMRVDVAAPGNDIMSTVPKTNCMLCDVSGYRYLSGTSMAAPHVAGIVGLILSRDGAADENVAREMLRHGADIFGKDIAVPDQYSGTGRVNAYKALNANSVGGGIAAIDSPPDYPMTQMSRDLSVSGTAEGEYQLAYSTDPYGGEWQIFGTGSAVSNGLLGTLPFSSLLPNRYTIRLSVNSGADSNEDVVSVDRKADVELSDPQNNDIDRLGDTLLIKGFVRSRTTTYSLDYTSHATTTVWHTEGIKMLPRPFNADNAQPIATWSTALTSLPGRYTLRLTSVRSDGAVHYQLIEVSLDPTLRPGWPQRINWNFIPNAAVSNASLLTDASGKALMALPSYPGQSHMQIAMQKDGKNGVLTVQNTTVVKNNTNGFSLNTPAANLGGYYYWGGMMESVAGDVNKDGQKEIFISPTGGNPPLMYGYTAKGSLLPGWPVTIPDTDMPGGNLSLPTLADINNDGKDEIITAGTNALYAFSYSGQLVETIPLQGALYAPPSLTTIADLGHTGSKEIVRTFSNFDLLPIGDRITVMDTQGKTLPGWPQMLYPRQGPDGNYYGCGTYPNLTAPAVGDIDNDGKDEIVIATMRNVFDNSQYGYHCEARIHAFHLDGTTVAGFPRDINGWVSGSVALADINNDGYKDIIIGTIDPMNKAQNGIYVVQHNGTDLPGWPKLPGSFTWGSVSVGDTNHDGMLEVAASVGLSTYVFIHDGTTSEVIPMDVYSLRSTVLADVNNDGSNDILTSASFPGNGLSGGIYAWDGTGSSLNGFPKSTESYAEAAPVITDLDANHSLELIGSSDQDSTTNNDSGWKYRGSVYVWNLGSPYGFTSLPWPMLHHDAQFTGSYTPIVTIKKPVLGIQE